LKALDRSDEIALRVLVCGGVIAGSALLWASRAGGQSVPPSPSALAAGLQHSSDLVPCSLIERVDEVTTAADGRVELFNVHLRDRRVLSVELTRNALPPAAPIDEIRRSALACRGGGLFAPAARRYGRFLTVAYGNTITYGPSESEQQRPALPLPERPPAGATPGRSTPFRRDDLRDWRVTFTKTFDLPRGMAVVLLELLVDDAYSVSLNDRPIGQDGGGGNATRPVVFDVTDVARAGQNVLHVTAVNRWTGLTDWRDNPAGVAFRLVARPTTAAENAALGGDGWTVVAWSDRSTLTEKGSAVEISRPSPDWARIAGAAWIWESEPMVLPTERKPWDETDDAVVPHPPGRELIVKAGDRTDLAPGVRVGFGRTGTAFAVPDVIFGRDYGLEEPREFNYLPVQGQIAVYAEGTRYTLTRTYCDSAERWDGDVIITEVSACHLVLSEEKVSRPRIAVGARAFTVPHSAARSTFRPDYSRTHRGQLVSENPLLYLSAPDYEIRRYDAGREWFAVGTDGRFDFVLVTSFGPLTFRYVPAQIAGGQRQERDVGPLHVGFAPRPRQPVANDVRAGDVEYFVEISPNLAPEAPRPLILSYSY
jgi:hypothetical protein